MSSKQKQKLESDIKLHVEAFLAKGGQITNLPYGMTKDDLHQWDVNNTIIMGNKADKK